MGEWVFPQLSVQVAGVAQLDTVQLGQCASAWPQLSCPGLPGSQCAPAQSAVGLPPQLSVQVNGLAQVEAVQPQRASRFPQVSRPGLFGSQSAPAHLLDGLVPQSSVHVSAWTHRLGRHVPQLASGLEQESRPGSRESHIRPKQDVALSPK